MARYFIELAYLGTGYSGFQLQDNAVTIQSEVEKAFSIYLRQAVHLTGSSRTDAGVHAFQNYFHVDLPEQLRIKQEKLCYHINAILPSGIVVKRVIEVLDTAHCRFDAVSRRYEYHLYGFKNPFIADRAYYFPYRINWEAMQEAAGIIKNTTEFESFSKRNTQVKTFRCTIQESNWEFTSDGMVYTVMGNRFLRGMVRGLVGTMLQVGREKITIQEFLAIIAAGDASRVDFSVPAHGLRLVAVNYPAGMFL